MENRQRGWNRKIAVDNWTARLNAPIKISSAGGQGWFQPRQHGHPFVNTFLMNLSTTLIRHFIPVSCSLHVNRENTTKPTTLIWNISSFYWLWTVAWWPLWCWLSSPNAWSSVCEQKIKSWQERSAPDKIWRPEMLVSTKSSTNHKFRIHRWFSSHNPLTPKLV